MLDETFSQDISIAVFEHLKMHYEALSALMVEVAALRETLLQQDNDQFSKTLRKNETAQIAKTTALGAELIASYTQMIRLLKAYRSCGGGTLGEHRACDRDS